MRILEMMMATLKLAGMRAFNEVMADGLKRQHSGASHPR